MGTKLALDLKVARRRSGLTQHDVAHLLNVDRTLLSKFERGHRMPSAEQVALLSLIYGRPVPDLYGASRQEWQAVLAERIKTLAMDDGPSTRTEALHTLRAKLTASQAPYGGED